MDEMNRNDPCTCGHARWMHDGGTGKCEPVEVSTLASGRPEPVGRRCDKNCQAFEPKATPPPNR
jgi:hypothetical protein